MSDQTMTIVAYITIAVLSIMAAIFLLFAISFVSTRDWGEALESVCYALGYLLTVWIITMNIP